MKNSISKMILGVVAGLAVASASSVMAANEFDYSSLSNAAINFTGSGHFNFTPTTSFVTGGSSLGPNGVGLFGGMTGTYTIGAITTISGTSTAPVTGSGGFFLTDAANVKLNGTLTFDNIIQSGTGSILNYTADVNLTGLSYAGSNPALQHLASQVSVMDTLDFTFIPAVSLSALVAGGQSTSFSGSINGTTASTPDGGMTVVLLGGAFTAMGLARSKFGKK
jgi:hypothetical protein